jgi:hypothetical protein
VFTVTVAAENKTIEAKLELAVVYKQGSHYNILRIL